jgi:asparagine synthase (glutamine-hydrolysing)
MCGIAGIVDLSGTGRIDPVLLSRMNDSLSHRGPDGADIHVEPGVGLAHRRLSIIDLAGGAQPLFNEDRSVVVVFNGEIYNFAALAGMLAARGHRFATHCDTEVIVHGWEEWGEDCVQRFEGMFAFALWDRRTGTLFLARDRVGIKPLYYAPIGEGQLIFGSELKALLVHPDLDPDLDPQSVLDFFAYGYVPDPRTIFRGVRKLAPGHTLTLHRGSPWPQPRQYWDLSFEAAPIADDDAAAGLVERLSRSVHSHLMSDVPLGAFLSGGIDSSSVVALMAADAGAGIDTCSIGFRESSFDESEYARAVSTRYATRHHEQQVLVDDFELIDRLAGIYDEPFADSSAMPTFRVCELARRFVTVALSGDGGDELFGGYRRYASHLREERRRLSTPAPVRHVAAMLSTGITATGWHGLPGRRTLRSLGSDAIDAYFQWVTGLGHDLAPLFSGSFRRETQGYSPVEVLREHDRKAPADPLSRVQYLDFKTYLPGDILTKVDRALAGSPRPVAGPSLDRVGDAAAAAGEAEERRRKVAVEAGHAALSARCASGSAQDGVCGALVAVAPGAASRQGP